MRMRWKAVVMISALAIGCLLLCTCKRKKDTFFILPSVANFSAAPTSGDAPLLVSFTDETSATVTAWAWDFDNDSTIDSTIQHPTHLYEIPGTYTVALTVTTPEGDYTKKRLGYIKVKTPDANWALLDDIGAPNALDEADPYGDDPLAFGDAADWAALKGTYDDYYVYLRALLYGSVNKTRAVQYVVFVDLDNDATVDYAFLWSGTRRLVFGQPIPPGKTVKIGALIELTAAQDGILIAFPRRLTDNVSFPVQALVEDIAHEQGDIMPDTGWGTFSF
jgi:PKD repeat protein